MYLRLEDRVVDRLLETWKLPETGGSYIPIYEVYFNQYEEALYERIMFMLSFIFAYIDYKTYLNDTN
jgi:hypothetical protein